MAGVVTVELANQRRPLPLADRPVATEILQRDPLLEQSEFALAQMVEALFVAENLQRALPRRRRSEFPVADRQQKRVDGL